MDRGAWWATCPWGRERVRRDLATKQQQPIDQMGLSWGLKFWAEGSLAADTLPPSRAVTALQGPAWKGLRRAVLPSPALHLISGPARGDQPARGWRGDGKEEGWRGGEVEGRKRTEGEGPERAGGKEGGPGARGDSNLAWLVSPTRTSGLSLPFPAPRGGNPLPTPSLRPSGHSQ